MPDDERSARRPGDAVRGDPANVAPDDRTGDSLEGPTVPDPPRHSALATMALDSETIEDAEALDDLQDLMEPAPRSSRAPATRPPPLPPGARTPSPTLPPPGRRLPRAGAPLDLRGIPEADKTKENRGAVGVKHAHSGALTTNATSGTISDDQTPIFNRAAIAAGPRAGRPGTLSTGSSGVSGVSGSYGSSSASAGGVSGVGRFGSPGASAITASPPIAVGDARTETVPAPAPRDSVAPLTGALAIKATRIGRSAAAELDDTRIPPPAHRPDPRALPAEPSAPGPATSGRTTAEALDELRVRNRDGSRASGPQTGGAIVIGGAVFNESSFASSTALAPVDAPPAAAQPVTRRDVAERGEPVAGAAAGGESRTSAAITIPARPGGVARSIAALPSRRGVAGDARYVVTAIAGRARARRELAQLASEAITRQEARRGQLVALGQTAVTDGVAHPAVEPARERLARIADERAQHTERVEAGDVELTRVRAEREAQAAQHAQNLAALDAELATLAGQRVPLDREVATIRARAAALRTSRDRLDAQIAPIQAALAGPKRAKLDVAATQARLAAMTADRAALQRAEPALAATIDELYPQLLANAAARSRAEHTRAERRAAELDQQGGAADVHAALSARRKVLDRATREADALRDQILRALGEELALDRPAGLREPLAALDELDQATSLADRRALELDELVVSVDRAKLARGGALLIIVIAVLAAGALYLMR